MSEFKFTETWDIYVWWAIIMIMACYFFGWPVLFFLAAMTLKVKVV